MRAVKALLILFGTSLPAYADGFDIAIPGRPGIPVILNGQEISYAVVDYARQHNARLIVLGVRQASLLASHVPEHITYRIITEASCPVLTMAYGSATTPIETPRGESKRVPARNTHA